MTTTKVYIFGADPLSQAGMAAYLAAEPEIRLMPESQVDAADVVLVVADLIDDATLRVLKAVHRDGSPRVLVLVGDVDATGVRAAVHAGAVGILRRATSTRDGLLTAIKAAAAGEGVLPPDLLGGLLRQVYAEEPGTGANRFCPSDRERRVLVMLSEGCDTREIARVMSYSERTVKNVIEDLTRRFGVRNRPHAVAYAMRRGFIE